MTQPRRFHHSGNEHALPSSFDELIRTADRPVLVDFFATWCSPCKMVAPVVKQLAAAYKGSLLVVKIDIDRKPQIAQQYQVTAVPTLVLFSGGRVVERIQGAQPFAALQQTVAPHLSRG